MVLLIQHHVLVKHKDQDYRFTCHKCEDTFENSSLLQTHLFCHHLNYCNCNKYSISLGHCKRTKPKPEPKTRPGPKSKTKLKAKSKIKPKPKSKIIAEKSRMSAQDDQVCKICGSGFGLIQTLNRHYLVAHMKTKFDCNSCGVPFNSFAVLENHVNAVHKGENYKHKCDKCKFSSRSVWTLQDHLLEEHLLGLKKCDHCDQKFQSMLQLGQHCKQDHFFKCQSCKNVYKTSDQLDFHQRLEHGHICKICDEKFDTESSLMIHKQIHENDSKRIKLSNDLEQKESIEDDIEIVDDLANIENTEVIANDKPVECQLCHRDFSDLELHYFADHLRMTFKCQFCSRMFKNFDEMDAHKSSEHKNEASETQDCHICKKPKTSTAILKEHLLQDHLGLRHSCKNCGQKFCSESVKNQHELNC